MGNKEEFMEYANRRLRDKKYKKRKLEVDTLSVQIDGIARCANGRWKPKQRARR